MGTILCVDDGTCALADRTHWLRAHGVAVLVADSLASALEALLTSPIDAVLLDCHMAGAILVASQLKQIRPALPVLMLTAYCGLPCRLAGLVTACVGKGESPAALLQKVRSVLEGAAPLCMAA